MTKSKRHFWKTHRAAAMLVNTHREMQALDLLTYRHQKVACVNTSQSLKCMPWVSSFEEPLPCLTWGTKTNLI